MSRKEEILRKAEEQRRLEAERKRLEDKPVRLHSSRMPLGCWIWIAVIGFLIVSGIAKLLK